MQSNQSNEKQVLLNLLSQRLGKRPEEIMQYAQNGNLSSLLQNMNPNDAATLQKVLNDQQTIQKLISSPQAQDLLRRLNGK
jgi:flagellar motility protein MotE (MotC chaperone)